MATDNTPVEPLNTAYALQFTIEQGRRILYYPQGISPLFWTAPAQPHTAELLRIRWYTSAPSQEKDLLRPFRVFQRRARAWILWIRAVRRWIANPRSILARAALGPAATHHLESSRP